MPPKRTKRVRFGQKIHRTQVHAQILSQYRRKPGQNIASDWLIANLDTVI